MYLQERVKNEYEKLKGLLYSPFTTFEEIEAETGLNIEKFKKRFKALEKYYYKHNLNNTQFIYLKARNYEKEDYSLYQKLERVVEDVKAKESDKAFQSSNIKQAIKQLERLKDEEYHYYINNRTKKSVIKQDTMGENEQVKITQKKTKREKITTKKRLGHIRQLAPTIIYFAIPFIIMCIFFNKFVVKNLNNWFFLNLDKNPLDFLLLNVQMLIVSIIFLKTLINVIRIIIFCIRAIAHEQDVATERGVMYWGGLGTGKTLSMLFDSYYTARANFLNIKKEFLLGKKKYFTKEFDSFESYERFRIVREAYYFYMNNACLPCLFTSNQVSIRERFTNKYSYKLAKIHFLQEKKLLESCVLCLDESGEMFSTEMSFDKENKERLNEYFSFARQYNDAYIKCTEQDKMDNMISLRRIIDINRHLKKLKKVLQPKLLIFLSNLVYFFANIRLNFKKRKIMKKQFKNEIDLTTYAKEINLTKFEYFILRLLNSTIRKIGFLKIKYFDSGGTESEKGGKIKKGSYLIACYIAFEYDSRANILNYKQRYGNFDTSINNSLLAS